jgi:hypothetical protein
VTLTVTDANGNTSTCDATVTIEDNMAPTALCQNITVQLDATGNVTITPAQIDNGSSRQLRGGDADHRRRSDPDVRLQQCRQPNGHPDRDRCANGNTSTCDATVTVEDNIAPTAHLSEHHGPT